MRKKVLLLTSPNEDSYLPLGYIMLPPLSLGILSSYLKENDYDTELIDLRFKFKKSVIPIYNKESFKYLYEKKRVFDYILSDKNDNEIDEILSLLLSDINIKDFYAIGISTGADFSFFEIHFAILIASYIKRKYNKIVIIGGNNLTYLYLFKEIFNELLKTILSSSIYVIKGAGEKTLLKLLNLIDEKKISEIENLEGVMYLKNGEIKANEENLPIIIKGDFDSLDLKNYSIYIDNGTEYDDEKNIDLVFQLPMYLRQFVNNLKSKNKNINEKTIIPYIFNYNCPYNCAFCVESDINKSKVIIGEVNKVVEDIQYLSEKYQSPYFYFLNNAFNSSPRFADELCNELIKKNIRIYWSDCARFNNLTKDRLVSMKEAGCKKLIFGFENS